MNTCLIEPKRCATVAIEGYLLKHVSAGVLMKKGSLEILLKREGNNGNNLPHSFQVLNSLLKIEHGNNSEINILTTYALISTKMTGRLKKIKKY